MTPSAQAMDTGGAASPGAEAPPCGCGDTIRALRTQITALRHALVDSESEKEAALRREADTKTEMAKDRRESEARREEDASTIATLRAWIEVHASGHWGQEDPAAVAVPSDACINDIMSAPLLAVQTALPRVEAEVGAVAAASEAAAAAVPGGGGSSAAPEGMAAEPKVAVPGGGGEESDLVKSLRSQLRVHENENTPPRLKSLKNKTRARYRAVVKLAFSCGAEEGEGECEDAAAGAKAAGEEEAAAAEGREPVVAKKTRGGQRGHKGASNNQKAQACFGVLLDECPDCHGTDFDDRRPGTKRMWDILGGWMRGLVPRDERARVMIELAMRLAADGAQGACVCISISLQRRYCRTCDKVVKASVTFLIGGSAIGEICQSLALMFSELVPDTCVASWLHDMSGFPLQYDAVRTGRLRRSITLGPINDKIEERIASAPSHAKDESPGKGYLAAEGAAGGAEAAAGAEGLPVPLEDAAEAAVAAVGATSNRTIQYLVATVHDAVMVRVSPDRSGKSIRERMQRLDGKPYGSDEYTVYANDKGTEIRQTDHPHLLRKTEYYAAEAMALLHAAERIAYKAVILHRRRSSEWARKAVGDIMNADPSATRFDGSVSTAAAAAAAAAAKAADGDDASALLGPGSCPPAPPIPPMPYLPLSAPPVPDAAAGGGGGPDPMDDEEASARRNEIAGDALFSGICHWIKFWDTASPETERRLQALVRLVIEHHYREGHPARKAVENAMDALFKALRIRGMKFDTTDVERAVRDVIHRERRAHKHIRCQEAADASSKAPSFTGSCRRNGISPMLAFRKILRDPEWSMFEEDRPPPPPQPPPEAAAAAHRP